METSTIFNQVGSTINGAHAPPSEDRYAALKDLDSLMKQTQLKEETAGMQSTWNANNTNGEYILPLRGETKRRSIIVLYALTLCNRLRRI